MDETDWTDGANGLNWAYGTGEKDGTDVADGTDGIDGNTQQDFRMRVCKG